MVGWSFSELHGNTSEELFIKNMMESNIGMPAPSPTMEMLGFKNLTQNFRTDSEELFKTWLTNGENNGCHSAAAGTGRRPRQASTRISAEIASLTNQTGVEIQNIKPNDDIIFPSPSYVAAADSSNDQYSNRTGVEKELQASNLFLAKAWFRSSQPMTRSRSSELRRRYVAMQNTLTPIGIEAMHAPSGNGLNNFKQESPNTNTFNNNISIQENPYQFNNAFMSPSNSSSSTFNNPQVGNVDKISSVVSMLKGTLECKKLFNQVEKETVGDSFFGYLNGEQGINVYENQGMYNQDGSRMGDGENGVLRAIEESLLEGIMGPVNQNQVITLSQEPSQSESSAAPHIVSNCFDVFDDHCVSVQAPSVCESSMNNQMGDGRSPEDCYRSKDFRERMYDNPKEEQKKGALIRYGSVTSTGSVDRGDPTKKRRVERSRKMAEAKERSSTPTIASDMQSILKRCENLEKEVRSLKLNLAFMNRKDSEQTKQIEELQKQNEELGDEKERLLEEIERIIAETGRM